MQTLLPRILLFAALLASLAARADERILAYHSDIAVDEDGSMRVRETIQVRAEGREIKRGIYREIPTTYRDGAGRVYRVPIDDIAVARDGAQEPFHTETVSNGIRIYAGHKDRQLDSGDYAYTFSYRTDRQIGFFAEHDELYWNVTGNGWAFPIDRASAAVRLPEGVPPDAMEGEGYTGPQGSKATHLRVERLPDGRMGYETTRPLGPREGLTLVLAWPRPFRSASSPSPSSPARSSPSS